VGKRRYKLFIPSTYRAASPASHPLLVLLHGCTQSPDDFAAGTRMNRLAEQHGFLVAYPAQSTAANSSKCWNWFRPADQERQGGEADLLAALTKSIIGKYSINPDQVYVAGLSAGAAMAVILGVTHPDVFAAVGAHSGLPFRAALDVPSAFAAMSGKSASPAHVSRASTETHGLAIPLIVFHGDRDKTVAASNADALVRQTVTACTGQPAGKVTEGTAGGRRYTRTVYTSLSGRALIELWKIQGAGHAWSGGSANGTYAVASGPDASAEMVRFFMQVRRRTIPRDS